MQSSLLASLVLPFALVLLPACGPDDPPAQDGSNGGSENAGGAGGSAGAGTGNAGSASSADHAQLRFVYRADWHEHLGTCAWISDYRIKFGANPVPVTATIDVMEDSVSQYVEVDGRTYEDSDVLHIFTCSKSQTSKQTLQLFGKLGIDLPLEPAKRYTVTLGGTAATLAEDP